MPARPTCSHVIAQLRQWTSLEYLGVPNEYGTVWNDDVLQTYLDKNSKVKTVVEYTPITAFDNLWDVYYPKVRNSHKLFIETDFKLYDIYEKEITTGFTFNSDNNSIVFLVPRNDERLWLVGTLFNIYEAAADIWDVKASETYTFVDWRAGHHFALQEKIHKHCVDMAHHYRSKTVKALPSITNVRF